MCLYIGDIGDNDYEREYISIYKVKEPELNFVDQETRDWEVFHFQYPNEKFNAESMLIDAITRELVIGEKYASKKYTVRSEGFLYKVAPLELKISVRNPGTWKPGYPGFLAFGRVRFFDFKTRVPGFSIFFII